VSCARQNGILTLMKLTHDSVRAIAPVPPKTEIIVFDDDVFGFGVRARLSGSKVFIVQYSIGNKQRRTSLGKVDIKDINQMREKAATILAAAEAERARNRAGRARVAPFWRRMV
jgi:hypothetical protein